MKRRWARYGVILLAVLLLAACGGGEDAVSAGGGAEIPDPASQGTGYPPEAKYIALTFDDGPRRDTTGPLLDGLRERGVPATFFVIGRQIPGNEDLLERMQAEGHQIGNHTYDHTRLLTAEPDKVVEEIHKTEVLLTELLGEGDYWLRPPYGSIGRTRAALVETPMIYWTVDPEDWKLLDAAKVTEHVVSHAEPWGIVLLHDFYPTSVEAALAVVDQLKGEGYTFVTVEELFRLRGVEPRAGCLYASPDKLRSLG